MAIDREGKDAEVHSAAMVFEDGVLKKLSVDDPDTVKRRGPGQIKVEVHRGGRRGR